MLQQFLTPRVLQPKDRATYPQPGIDFFLLDARFQFLLTCFLTVQNVLVHCHSGHSRSVTIAALYLNYAYQTVFPTYDVALQFVKTKRGVLTTRLILVCYLLLTTTQVYKMTPTFRSLPLHFLPGPSATNSASVDAAW